MNKFLNVINGMLDIYRVEKIINYVKNVFVFRGIKVILINFFGDFLLLERMFKFWLFIMIEW